MTTLVKSTAVLAARSSPGSTGERWCHHAVRCRQSRLRSMRIEVPLLLQARITKGAAIDLRGCSRHGAPDRKIVGGPRFASLRKKIEMLFAHLKRILKLDRLRLRGPNGARDEFILAVAAQNP